MQMATTITGMHPNDRKGVYAAAALPLWKNILFSATGGVCGESWVRLSQFMCDALRDTRTCMF